MKELREMLETVRAKDLREITPEEVKALIVLAIKTAGVISGITAAIGIITNLVTILAAVKE